MIVPIRRYDSIDSTNEEARRLAETGEFGPLWIVAREQTGGRGRRGRAWISQPGNLFATYLTALPEPAGDCAQLSFAAGLAAAETIGHFAASSHVTLKWPNDVLLEGCKVAGILLESGNTQAQRNSRWLAVGIGINLAHFPDHTEFPAISLAAVTGSAPDPELALARLGKAWDTWYGAWREGGFAALRDAWLARAAGLGQRIGARLAKSLIEGVFVTLDQDGALVLRGPDGALSRVTAGDVFFPA